MIVINITNYNQSRFIHELFDSLYPQIKDANDVQVNWVDDCSTDDSVEIAKAHPMASLPCVKIIKHRTNKWVSTSRNESIKKLTDQDWITFIDGDDKVKPNYIDILRSYVLDNKQDVYVFDYDNFADDIAMDVSRIVKVDNVMVWSRLYRGKLLLDNKIIFQDKFKEQGFGEDGDFNERVSAVTDKIISTGDIIYEYRWGVEGSLSNTHQ